MLNFTYTIENPPDGKFSTKITFSIFASFKDYKLLTRFLRYITIGKWGHVEADGTWSGLVRHAKDGIVDFVICDVFLTYSRAQV